MKRMPLLIALALLGATVALAEDVMPLPEGVSAGTLAAEAEEFALAEEVAASALGERILYSGMEGEDVAVVQERLAALYYYTGEIDGKFGRMTTKAVRAFQRASGLEKIDGKVGPVTLNALFAQDAIAAPSPTPSPTPSPSPSPAPTPTPVPTPVATSTPDIAAAPFAMESAEVSAMGQSLTLLVGLDEQGETLYPLCGVLGSIGFEYAYAQGSWQLSRKTDGAEIVLMTDGQDGLCTGAMAASGGVIILADEEKRVYVFGEEAYVTGAMLEALGVSVGETEAGDVVE